MLQRIGGQRSFLDGLGANSPFKYTLRSGSPLSSNNPLSPSSNSDAAIVELSLNAKSTNSLSSSNTSNSNNSAISDYFTYIADVSGRITKINQELAKGGIGSTQSAALRQELQSLTQEYSQSVNNKDFSNLQGFAQYLLGQSSGQNSSDFTDFSNSAFGQELSKLASSNNTTALSFISQGVSTIQSTSGDKLLSDSSAADAIAQAARGVAAALNGLQGGQTKATGKAVPLIQSDNNSITPTELSFVGSDNVALTLKTYLGTDLVKAAQMGIPSDVASTLMLVANPKEHTAEKDDTKTNSDVLAQPQTSEDKGSAANNSV